jgi:hypothetical protein
MMERRASPRVEAPFVSRLRGVDGMGQRFRDDTLLDNLSGGGVYLRTQRMLVEGTDVTLAVRLSTAPPGDRPVLRLAARGIVVRVEPQPDGGSGVGIEFKRRRVL